jgi:clan AA aspartic protease (TIGR02281 family)
MRNLLIIFSIITSISISAQITITMELDGGVYKVPCIVNGAKMKFIFDTGASTVCLSESMAEYLLDNDYLSRADIVGIGTSIVADGSEVEHVKIILRDIEIGGLHLKDVDACIIEGQKAPLLLGQTAIQKLGEIRIDGNRLVINGYASMSDAEAEKVFAQARMLFIEKSNYEETANVFRDLEEKNRFFCEKHVGRSDFSFIYMYSYSLWHTECYKECIEVLERYQHINSSYPQGDSVIYVNGWDSWESFMEQENLYVQGILLPPQEEDGFWDRLDLSNETNHLLSLYERYAFCLKFEGRYRDAIKYYNRADIIGSSRMKNRPIGDPDVISNRNAMASCYRKIKEISTAKEICENNIRQRCHALGITKSDIESNNVKDRILGECYYYYAGIMSDYTKEYDLNPQKAREIYDKCMILAAKCGETYCIEYCQKYNLPYLSTSALLY